MTVYFSIVDYTMANIEKLLIRLLRYKLKYGYNILVWRIYIKYVSNYWSSKFSFITISWRSVCKDVVAKNSAFLYQFLLPFFYLFSVVGWHLRDEHTWVLVLRSSLAARYSLLGARNSHWLFIQFLLNELIILIYYCILLLRWSHFTIRIILVYLCFVFPIRVITSIQIYICWFLLWTADMIRNDLFIYQILWTFVKAVILIYFFIIFRT